MGREVQRDLADILADSSFAITDYNATSYFIYKGEPMGYQYDMLRDLAPIWGKARNRDRERYRQIVWNAQEGQG